VPELITGADIGAEYVELLRGVSTTVERAAAIVAAVERSIAEAGRLSTARRALAAELFHAPGQATDRAIDELYTLMDLERPARVQPAARVGYGERRRSVRLVPVTEMRLDVLIATYNRSDLLADALESVLIADRPAGWDVSVTVIDNRSTRRHQAVVESFIPRFDGRLHYLYEPQAGRSHALNAGSPRPAVTWWQ
jgi:hypothetical protein